MELNGVVPVFVAGMGGPVLMELVKIAAWRDARIVINRYKEPVYRVSTAALLVLGGVVAVLNGVERVPVAHAIQLGITAPAIVAGYATASIPRGASGMELRVTWREKIRRMLAWTP